MTPIEFLARLRLLPTSTPLSLPHVGAVLEMLSAVLDRKPNRDVVQSARWSQASALAEWLDEPITTIEAWRVDGAAGHRYELGAVLAWLDEHLVPFSADGKEASPDRDRAPHAYWAEQIPAIVVDDRLIGFFRSVALERDPAGYQILHADLVEDGDGIRAFDARDITKAAALTFPDVCQAYGEFASKVGKRSDEARQIYLKWQKDAMPVILLRFFRCALLHDPKLASEIAASLDSVLIRKGFHLAEWLWSLWLDAGLASLDSGQLGAIIKVLDAHDVKVNQASCVRNGNKRMVFQGTAAHLLADTAGTTFRGPALQGRDGVIYNSLLMALFERELNAELPNLNQQTGLSIATAVAESEGASPFLQALGSFTLREKLETELPSSDPPARSKRFERAL